MGATGRQVAWLIVLAVSGRTAAAQGPAGWLQAEGFYHHVTNDFGDWKGVALRAVAPAGSRNIWYGDLLAQEAFDDRGVYAVVANRHIFSPSWFSLVSVGTGTGDFFFPDLRADAALGKAWLPRRNLVTILGATYVKSKSIYEDFAVSGTVATYFPGVTLEAGGRINWSWPDAIRSERVYGAITLGRERQRLIVLRAGGGTEGYQLTGVVETERSFSSSEATVSWREWLGGHVGFVLGGEFYDNPFYTRTGVVFGLFRHW